MPKSKKIYSFSSNTLVYQVKNIIVRKAHYGDFDDLYSIWMQDHVLPFMSFGKLDPATFRPIFETLMNESEIYVIEKNHQVIATRRIIFNTQQRAHNVEFASFGVHQNYLKQGLGKHLYDFLIAKIRCEHPHIKRIEIRQEINNAIALKLAKKMGFESEVIFPERSSRIRDDGEIYYLASRFLVYFLDETIKQQSIYADNDDFDLQIPPLNMDQIKPSKIGIHFENSKSAQQKSIAIFYHHKKMAVCNITQGTRAFSHIQFWSIELMPGFDFKVLEVALRELLLNASTECKKIEIYTHSLITQALLQRIGFQYRGKRKASICQNGDYYDEIAADFSFFNIEDAHRLLQNQIIGTNNNTRQQLLTSLKDYRRSINQALAEKKIDPFGNLYLENCVFQVARDSIDFPH